jgi:hypothetical protein
MSTLTIESCSLSRNKLVTPKTSKLALYGGGAVTVLGTNATAVISDTDFKQNNASYGAAILSDLGAVMLLQKVSTAGTCSY